MVILKDFWLKTGQKYARGRLAQSINITDDGCVHTPAIPRL